MSKDQIQPENVVIIAKDLGGVMEIILKTRDFNQACLTFLEEWQKDRRVCMLDYTPSMIIAACALRYHREKQEFLQVRGQGWPE